MAEVNIVPQTDLPRREESNFYANFYVPRVLPNKAICNGVHNTSLALAQSTIQRTRLVWAP